MKISSIKGKELYRFLIGGGSAVIVDFAMYKVLMLAGVDRDIAKACSFVLGAVVGFVINKLWTFESSKFLRGEIIRYIILYLCTAAINAFINRCILATFGIEIVAFLGATGVSTVLNFLGQKYFVFQK
ncbi:MAG: GtrA family protein [Eubacterium sp.]|nr:GtrA family protein [Eubacterium sp.]